MPRDPRDPSARSSQKLGADYLERELAPVIKQADEPSAHDKPSGSELHEPARDWSWRSKERFDLQHLREEFSRDVERAQKTINKIIHKILTKNDISDTRQFLNDEFYARVPKFDEDYYLDDIIAGNFGLIEKGDIGLVRSSFVDAQELWQNEQRFVLYIKDRLNGYIYSPQPPHVAERLERLSAYAREYGEEGLEEYARLLFPNWSFAENNTLDVSSPIMLPKVAPETFLGLRGPESPPDFVKRVYKPWLGNGLDRAHIRHLDPVLYAAINNWLKKPGCDWPSDVDLPTRQEQNDRTLLALRERAPDGQIGRVIGDFTAKEADRIRGLLQRRRQK